MRRLASISILMLAALLALVLILPRGSSASGKPYDVRAIFDDAGFAVPGEQVRIAGAPVGSIRSLDVRPNGVGVWKAAVTLQIDNAAFTPFHANATCTIRPQSLIAERYVDCTPGSTAAPTLAKIGSGPGAGTYLLPVTRTSSPIDTDILQNISQQPIRQRFALILNELGTGLAARGSDLNAVIHRANPALGYTDQVFQILARENRTLAQLATDSDAVLGPLARARHSLSDFVVQANTTAVASAARAADISRSFQLFPSFLRQLRPLMVQLGNLADQGTPLMASLGQAATALGQQFNNLIGFAPIARKALIGLGASSQASQPYLLKTLPLANQLNSLGSQALPSATLLDRLTSSLNSTGALEYLMTLLFNGTSATNGFDARGHFARVQPLVGDCTGYALTTVNGCSANFGNATTASAASVVSGGPPVSRSQAGSGASLLRPSGGASVAGLLSHQAAALSKRAGTFRGLLEYLIGSK
jgi:ABC-type transporter Mla subunit MlaD